MRRTPLDTTIDSVAGYLRRRRRSALALTTGEAATLAIGVVRGCAAAPSRAAEGEWRLTAEGRPVFRDDLEGTDAMAATIEVLDEVVSLVDDDVRPGFARLRDGILTEPPPRWDILTRRLLAVVEPRPLVLGPLTVVRADDPPPHHDGRSEDAAGPLLGRVREALRGVPRRVLLVGAGVTAAFILGVAAISQPAAPPDAPQVGEEAVASPAAEQLRMTEETAAPSPSGSVPPDQPGMTRKGAEVAPPIETSAPPAEDTKATALAVLRSLASCTDAICAARLWESRPPGAPALLDPEMAELDVIDDFGGLAVVRLVTEERTQYVTLVQQEDRWLVRSLEEVADQPS